MFAAESYTSRHCIAIVAMACLCVLLGGPSYAAGAESLIIAGATYYEPGVSGPGWAWTDADHLELNGYVAQDKHNDQDYGDQDYAARVLQAKSRHCDRSDDPQARRQQLDSRFLNAFPSWDSAPGCRTSLLIPRLVRPGEK